MNIVISQRTSEPSQSKVQHKTIRGGLQRKPGPFCHFKNPSITDSYEFGLSFPPSDSLDVFAYTECACV